MESTEPVVSFAFLRVAIAVLALLGELAFDVPHRKTLLIVTVAVLVWAVAAANLAQRSAEFAMSPLIAVVDISFVAITLALVPAVYPAAQFIAVFLVAAHAQYQVEQRGLAIATYAVVVLVPIAAIGNTPVSGGLLAFFECLFAAATLGAGMLMGRMRTAESTGRLRARELSRRVIEAEGEVRRRVAESIHDGPVQELVSLDMMLSTARSLLDRGETERAKEMIEEAQSLAERNIGVLREEIVGLGPYGLEQLSLDAAIEECADSWRKRYGVDIHLALDRVDLPNDICGGLFGIAQEAVTNAGRHSGAASVWVGVHALEDEVELRVRDDGKGFADESPLGANQRGHIGLASMRERAELMSGSLKIDTGPEGSTVVARVPVPEGPEANGAPSRGPRSAAERAKREGEA
jgi:signal transduction histidine kinase